MTCLDDIKFDEKGLIPAIAQCAQTKNVLMLAWMNRQALETTILEQRAVYFSRSRQSLWRKGEKSGNIQRLVDLSIDCDSDAILLSVEQIGDIACHTGRNSCFFRTKDDNGWLINQTVRRDPEEMYNE